MTKILIPRSDSISAKRVAPSDWEKYFDSPEFYDYVKRGFEFTIPNSNRREINVGIGDARVIGLNVQNTENELVTLSRSATNYIYINIIRDANNQAQAWDFLVNQTGEDIVDAYRIGSAVTNNAGVTSIDTSYRVRINHNIFGFVGTGDEINSIPDTYAGMLAFCTDANDDFQVSRLYRRDENNEYWLPLAESNYIYGTGYDGDVVIDRDTEINEVKYYRNLTINNNAKLSSTSNPMLIYVSERLIVNGAITSDGLGGAGGNGGNGGNSVVPLSSVPNTFTPYNGESGDVGESAEPAMGIATAGNDGVSTIGGRGGSAGRGGEILRVERINKDDYTAIQNRLNIASRVGGDGANGQGGGGGGAGGNGSTQGTVIPSGEGGDGGISGGDGGVAGVIDRDIISNLDNFVNRKPIIVGAGGGGGAGGSGGGSASGTSMNELSGGMGGHQSDGNDGVDGRSVIQRGMQVGRGGSGGGGGGGGKGGGAICIFARDIVIEPNGRISCEGTSGFLGGMGGHGGNGMNVHDAGNPPMASSDAARQGGRGAGGGGGGASVGGSGAGGNGGLLILIYNALRNKGIISVRGGVERTAIQNESNGGDAGIATHTILSASQFANTTSNSIIYPWGTSGGRGGSAGRSAMPNGAAGEDGILLQVQN